METTIKKKRTIIVSLVIKSLMKSFPEIRLPIMKTSKKLKASGKYTLIIVGKQFDGNSSHARTLTIAYECELLSGKWETITQTFVCHWKIKLAKRRS